ncbi:hypothetical protein CALCODRAFT_532623 [Calocera cornea HHB12733]|uniref:Non-structural maintenance of chromosomes element 1 homolog n=1 Tax=Calocera cornea HHB12733 TaxID=1353952 RepID=A0A165IDA9_9BASI|nr:hypothetical protein CALCODRAFT_532623 [Calocera cornea HHB12733]
MARYSDVHRLFLQSLISRRFLSIKLAEKLYDRACEIVAAAEGTEPSRQPFEAALGQVGDALGPIGLEIRKLQDEGTKVIMMAIVNTKGDAIAQVATEFSPNEIAYFKLIVEVIMLAPSESFSVSSIAAIKESTNLPSKMTKTEAESTLNAFVSRGWLIKSQRGRYSLSTRSLMELQTYLKTEFVDEVLECSLCMEIVTKGIACPSARCKTRMHKHCYETYRAQGHKVCPSDCGASWNDIQPIPVGEDAVTERQDRGRARRRVEQEETMEAEAEEYDEPMEASQELEEEEEEPEASASPPPVQRKSRQQKVSQRSNASRYYDDEAEED